MGRQDLAEYRVGFLVLPPLLRLLLRSSYTKAERLEPLNPKPLNPKPLNP